MSAKKALILIAEGSEEIEAVTPMDVLRRAGVSWTVSWDSISWYCILVGNKYLGFIFNVFFAADRWKLQWLD